MSAQAQTYGYDDYARQENAFVDARWRYEDVSAGAQECYRNG